MQRQQCDFTRARVGNLIGAVGIRLIDDLFANRLREVLFPIRPGSSRRFVGTINVGDDDRIGVDELVGRFGRVGQEPALLIGEFRGQCLGAMDRQPGAGHRSGLALADDFLRLHRLLSRNAYVNHHCGQTEEQNGPCPQAAGTTFDETVLTFRPLRGRHFRHECFLDLKTWPATKPHQYTPNAG